MHMRQVAAAPRCVVCIQALVVLSFHSRAIKYVTQVPTVEACDTTVQ